MSLWLSGGVVSLGVCWGQTFKGQFMLLRILNDCWVRLYLTSLFIPPVVLVSVFGILMFLLFLY